MNNKILVITAVPASMKILLKGKLKFLGSNGFDVYCASSPGKEIESVILDEDVKDYFSINIKRNISIFNDFKALFQLFLLIRKLQPTIVHTYTPKAGLLGMCAAFLAGVPLKLHNVTGLPLMEEKGLKKRLLFFFEWLTYVFADYIYVNSFGLLEFINVKISKNSKIKILGNGSTNGINGDYFKSNETIRKESAKIKYLHNLEGNFIWLFIGRIVADKGINELILAFDCLSRKYPMKLLLVGNFEEELDPISKESKEILYNNQEIIVLGFQNDVRPFLGLANCLVFPSYREGLPNVPMQASCFNLPIIATDINGCNEVVKHDYNGILINAKDSISLEKTMELVYLNKDLKEKLGQNGREYVLSKYSQPNVWSNLLIEYQMLLKNVY